MFDWQAVQPCGCDTPGFGAFLFLDLFHPDNNIRWGQAVEQDGVLELVNADYKVCLHFNEKPTKYKNTTERGMGRKAKGTCGP